MNINLPVGSPMRSPDFLFGVATSTFQIEGAAETREPGIWDTFCDSPGRILDGSNGRAACDHVNRYSEDIALMVELGVDAYRFSIAWPRMIRADGSLNSGGCDFYLRLIDGLNEHGIRPFVTLYHWDLPQYLEDKGGWLNRDTAYRFQDYTDAVTRVLGDRVYSWATLNEPLCSSYMAYELGNHAPGNTNRAEAKKAAHHLLLAHGLGMQTLRHNCPGAMHGIVVNLSPCHPASGSDADQAAAHRADQDLNQWYVMPVLAGEYPDLIRSLPEHEVPEIRDGDLETIHQPLDFFGVNYYTRGVFRDAEGVLYEGVPVEGSTLTEMGWEIYPKGLAEVLEMLQRSYDLPPVYITENGSAMRDTLSAGRVHDPARARYFEQHLNELDRAMRSGVDVRGYFAWSLMDNFEWAEGYTKRFGLVYVDFETQERVIKDSGLAYRDMLKTRITG